jgi:hypothetical protein
LQVSPFSSSASLLGLSVGFAFFLSTLKCRRYLRKLGVFKARVALYVLVFLKL